MRCSMKPVVDKVHSNKTKVPCPRRVPRKFHQMEIVINKHIESQFSTQYNYPVEMKKEDNLISDFYKQVDDGLPVPP